MNNYLGENSLKKTLILTKDYVDNQGELLEDEIISKIIAENLLPYPYSETTHNEKGIDWTDNGDGTVTANGTNTGTSFSWFAFATADTFWLEKGEYTIVGCPAGGGASTYYIRVADNNNTAIASDLGNGKTFTINQDMYVRASAVVAAGVTVSNLVFKPMIVKGDIKSQEYQPYNLSRYKLREDIDVKASSEEIIVDNLLPYPYFETTHTQENVKWTVDENGVITANGISSGRSQFHITHSSQSTKFLEVGKTYHFSGCPDGGSSSTYRIIFTTYKVIDGTVTALQTVGVANSLGASLTITQEYDGLLIYIDIFQGYNAQNLVFKPMIEVGNVAHPWQPYKLSRYKLREDIDAKASNEEIIAENLLSYPYFETTHEQNGITWTDNGDGTIIANGTNTGASTSVSVFKLAYCAASVDKQLWLDPGTYTFYGCPEGGSSSTWRTRIGTGTSATFLGQDFGTGFTFTLTERTLIDADLQVYGGTTVSNLVFKPMIVKVISDTYQPYAKSRQSIIKQIVVENLVEHNIDSTGFVRCATKAYSSGTCILTADGTSGNPYHYRDYVLEKGKTFTFSTIGNSEDSKGFYMSVLYVFDTSPVTFETIKTVIYKNGHGSVTFTTSKECKYLRIILGIPNGSSVVGTKATFTEMMLEEGITAHKYQLPKAFDGHNRIDITNHTVDLDTLTLSSGTPHIIRYIEKTDGGATNITNTPVAKKPFTLDVELVRWASPADYVSKQTFVTSSAPNFEYVRWCTSGTWSEWVERKFSDTTYTHPSYTARTGVPTANQTPSFGGTFTVSQPVSDATGHITAVNSRTVTIPNTNASTTSAGLMSSTDKSKSDMTNIAYATCDTAAATSAKVATIDGNSNWKLQKGSIVVVKYTNTNTASNITLNVNNTGAKSIWYNNAVNTSNSNIIGGYAGRITTFMYDGTYWVWMGQGADSNTTYTNQALGQGYATCTTAADTAAKVATMSGYVLLLGGIVSVKFNNAVPASATLNINSKGAKNIFYRGSAIVAGIINAGDIATFIFDGTQYHLISIDKGILNNTTKGSLGYNSSTAQNLVPTVSTLAFWDGAYANTSSNLAYCKLGAFGDAAVKGVDTTPTSGSVNLVTSGGVYDELNKPDYGTCSTAAATVEKAVTCTGWELKTGAEITVKFTVTNTANNPTLNVNNTGAKPIYYRGSAITAGYLAANRTYTFRYNGTQYEFVGDLDTNNYDRIRYNGNIKANTSAIATGHIIVGSNGLYRQLNSGVPFDITYPILYAGSAIAANGTGSNNYKAIAATITTTQSITLTQYKPVYIKGKLVGTTFSPVSTAPLTQTIPTTEDGYHYILLGLAYATNGLYLYPENPIYEYSNGSFRLYGDLSSNDIVNDLSTAVAVTNTETPVGCGVAKELNQKMLQIVSFDLSTGTLVTKSYDYTG